jgi:hypothetical protein
MPSTAGMSNPLQTIEPDEGGFSTLDRNARQSQRNIASIRNGFTRTGTLPRFVAYSICRGHRGRDRMLVGFTTTYAIRSMTKAP